MLRVRRPILFVFLCIASIFLAGRNLAAQAAPLGLDHEQLGACGQ